LFFDKGVLNIAMGSTIWGSYTSGAVLFVLRRTIEGVEVMTLDHVGFGERAFGALAFALLLLAAPLTAAVFLAQAL
jgi:hypothetical protein